MKNKFWLVVAMYLIWASILPSPSLAQGGCPHRVVSYVGNQASYTPYNIVSSIELAPSIPENPEPNIKVEGIYYQNTVTFDFYPDEWIAILASNRSGRGEPCSDDAVWLESSAGLGYTLDYRSQGKISSRQPVDISGLFKPGRNTLTVRLVDISLDRRSSSPYYVVIIEPASFRSIIPRAEVFPLATPIPKPTATPMVTPTEITPTVDYLLSLRLEMLPKSPTSTPTSTPVVVVKYVPLPVPERLEPMVSEGEVSSTKPGWNLWQVEWWWWLPWGLLSWGLVGLALMGRQMLRHRRMWGVIKIEDEDGMRLIEDDLANRSGQYTIGYDESADAVVPRGGDDEATGDILAVISSQKDDLGSKQMVLVRLDTDDLAEEDRVQPLYHGSEIPLQSMVLTYFDWQNQVDEADDDDEDNDIDLSDL